MRMPRSGRQMLHGKGRLIEPGLPRRVDRHVHHGAHAKSEQDSFLHPGIHAPSGFGGTVRLGRTNLARVQRLLEALEEIEMLVGVCLQVFRRTSFSISACMHAPAGQQSQAFPAPFRSSRDWPDSAGTMAGATPAPAIPSAPCAAFTGIGFDSTKFTSISGRYCAAARERQRNRWPERAG